MDLPFLNLDIEPTNRCNAKCYFCPRDATPHQGLMSMPTFERSVARAVEFRDQARPVFGVDLKVNLCGLGEPLLNRHLPEMVRMVRDADLECSISTNAALLSEERAVALLDAGLQGIEINVGEQGEEYEDVYKLPWERTRDNVVRFKELAGDRCNVRVVLVDHRRDPEHLQAMVRYWKEQGIDQFLPFQIMNRGGALFVDHMQYEAYPELAEARARFEEAGTEPWCIVPFVLLFIGYDGQYYLCCSDWTKEAPLGSVFERSFLDLTADKLERVVSRQPVCRTCNLDPLNRLTEKLHFSPDDGPGADALVDEIVEADVLARQVVEELEGMAPSGAAPAGRRLIPVRAV